MGHSEVRVGNALYSEAGLGGFSRGMVYGWQSATASASIPDTSAGRFLARVYHHLRPHTLASCFVAARAAQKDKGRVSWGSSQSRGFRLGLRHRCLGPVRQGNERRGEHTRAAVDCRRGLVGQRSHHCGCGLGSSAGIKTGHLGGLILSAGPGSGGWSTGRVGLGHRWGGGGGTGLKLNLNEFCKVVQHSVDHRAAGGP